MKKIILSLFALGFAAVIAYSGYRIWLIQADYRAESKMHDKMMEYRPEDNPEELPADEIINQSVIDLQSKYPDTVGWLRVPDTNIDYPFVWYKNNDYYLRRDMNGEYALAGTLFIDYRCEKDFSSRNTIIYGHNMKNGSMFGALNSFNSKAFFEENRYAVIYLPNANLTIEFFAYMVVRPNDAEVYNTEPGETYLDYIKQSARHYRDIGLTDKDSFITLSTCSYEFNDARMVLIAKYSS